MSVKISACWISSVILLGFVLSVRSEHFYLPKENNVFSGDPKDDWIPVSGIDKRSTRFGAADLTRVVHITPPVRYPSNRPPIINRPAHVMEAEESNKIEVFAQPPPAILGSFSDFGHATVEAREPAHALNFRPSAFDRLYDEIDDRRFQLQNDYREPVQDEQKSALQPPAIVVFNAQQRHPQNYHKTPPQAQYYQNFQYRDVNNQNNNKNVGYNKEQQDLPRRLTPYFVPNDHIYPRPSSQGNNKQAYADARPKPYSEPIQQKQQQHHYQQQQQQNQQQQQQQQQQSYKLHSSSTEGAAGGYYQKYHPGRVVDGGHNPYPPQVSTFARPFELQTGGPGDRNVFIRPDQYVQDLNVGTEVRFGPQEQQHGAQHQPSRLQSAVSPLETSMVSTAAAGFTHAATGFTHPATRPFSKYQTPSPKNEELYRIFPVKEVNALPPAFLPTPISLLQRDTAKPASRPSAYYKEPSSIGSSEYEAQERPEQDEDEESGEQSYDVLRRPTKPMPTTTTATTTTTTTTFAPPRVTRKRKPVTTTTTTTTTTAAPDDYDDYAVPNRQQLQLQEHYRPQEYYESTASSITAASTTSTSTTTSTTEAAIEPEERPLPVSVNKYKKKKPLPAARPKEQQSVAEEQMPPNVTSSPPTVTTSAETASPPHVVPSQSSSEQDARTKTRPKYGNGTRPRFSIKDYKTTTTTTSTTTSTEKAPSSGRRTTTAEPETVVEQQTTRKQYRPRPRPNRYKTSTSTTTSTEGPLQRLQESTTGTTAYRTKYKPGVKYYNRLRTSTESTVPASDDGGEPSTEPSRPTAVYSAKRRTLPTMKMPAAEEHNAVRRSSTASPLDDDDDDDVVTPPPPPPSEPLDAASSEDVDYVATTVAVTPAVVPSTQNKYHHTSYAVVEQRPLLPIESFFQSSMAAASKRYHNHSERQ